MKIEIIKSKSNQIGFSVNFLKNNQTVNFSQIDASYIPFFINAYKEFISSIEYKQHKNFLKRIKFDLNTIKNMLKSKEFSLFAFFSKSSLPILFFSFDKIYSIDGSSGKYFGETLIRGGKMKNIFNLYYSTIQLCYFHILNLNLLFRLHMMENKYSSQIIDNLLSYFRIIILVGIGIFNIYLYLDILYSNDPLKIIFFNVLWSFISLIGIPLSRWLPKKILYYIINKRISAIFTANKDPTKMKHLNSR